MKRIKVLICDEEQEYLQRFMTYFSNRNGNSKLDIRLVSNQSSLRKRIEEMEFDMLVISPKFLGEDDIKKIRVIALLNDESYSEEFTYPTIKKYQALSKLEKDIIEVYFDAVGLNEQYIEETSRTQVISVFSMNSSVGKTLYAITMAKELVRRGHRVFFLNLETIHSTSLFLKDENNNQASSEIIYYVQNRSDKLLSKIEGSKRKDIEGEFEYFDFINNPEEMQEFTGEDAEYLLQMLKGREDYDYIIVDMDSQMHERNQSILRKSNEIIWLMRNDRISIFKTEYTARYSEKLLGIDCYNEAKVHFVTSCCINGDYLDTELPIQGALPYIAEWQFAERVEEQLEHRGFAQAVLHSLENVLPDTEKMNG